jgi:hypothetical protein
MKSKSDLTDHIDAITTDPAVNDFFIVVAGEKGSYCAAKTIGADIVSALAETIVEQENGLSIINEMQLAIFKAKELAKQMMMKKTKVFH